MTYHEHARERIAFAERMIEFYSNEMKYYRTIINGDYSEITKRKATREYNRCAYRKRQCQADIELNKKRLLENDFVLF